jgi:hypothetical protein
VTQTGGRSLKPLLQNTDTGDSRYTRLRHPRFHTCVVLFQYHEEHNKYPIRENGRSCHAGPLSCARSFTESPHHCDSGDYKLRLLMVFHSENLWALYVSRFSRFRYMRWFIGTRLPRVARVTCTVHFSRYRGRLTSGLLQLTTSGVGNKTPCHTSMVVRTVDILQRSWYTCDNLDEMWKTTKPTKVRHVFLYLWKFPLATLHVNKDLPGEFSGKASDLYSRCIQFELRPESG